MSHLYVWCFLKSSWRSTGCNYSYWTHSGKFCPITHLNSSTLCNLLIHRCVHAGFGSSWGLKTDTSSSLTASAPSHGNLALIVWWWWFVWCNNLMSDRSVEKESFLCKTFCCVCFNIVWIHELHLNHFNHINFIFLFVYTNSWWF